MRCDVKDGKDVCIRRDVKYTDGKVVSSTKLVFDFDRRAKIVKLNI